MDKAEEENEEKLVQETSRGVARTFAYSANVLAQLFWMAISVMLLVGASHGSRQVWWWDISSVVEPEPIGPWERINNATGKLFPSVLLPLLIIFPPIFRRRKYRVITTLVLCSVGLLLQTIHLISTLVWAFQADTASLKMRLAELLLRELIAALLAALLGFVLAMTYRSWKKGKATNIAVDMNQSYIHGASVCLIVLSAMAVINSSSKVVSGILPLSMSTMLILVQLLHYATYHTGFYTRHRAIIAMDKFVDEFSLTKFEKDLIKKPQTERVIDNMLTKPLYPRAQDLFPW